MPMVTLLGGPLNGMRRRFGTRQQRIVIGSYDPDLTLQVGHRYDRTTAKHAIFVQTMKVRL